MSQPVTFEPGVHYIFQGVGYQVIQLLSDGMLIALNLTTNTQVTHHLDVLWQHWQENTLEFAREGPNLRDMAGTHLKTTYTFPDLADLPPKLREITWNRYQLIRPLIHLSPRQRTKQVVEVTLPRFDSDPAPDLWKGKILGYTLSQGEQDHAKSPKDLYT